MRYAAIVARWTVRITGILQILVGIGIWSGQALGLIPFHMMSGSLFVLALLVLGGLSIAARRRVGLGVFGILWGIGVAGFGMAQMGLMVGAAHWVIRTLHLLVGLAAMGIADRLGAGLLAPRAVASAAAGSRQAVA